MIKYNISDEYCNFINNYNENSTDMIEEYMRLLEKASDMDKSFDAWKNNGLNDAEEKYYVEVSMRVAQKTLECI